jgi:hypothetical protein
MIAICTPIGPCCCVSDESPLGPIGGVCTIIFSIGSFITARVTLNTMSSLKSFDESQRGDLTILHDFNGCSDEQTSVPKEIVENYSISRGSNVTTVCMTIISVVLVGRLILWLTVFLLNRKGED